MMTFRHRVANAVAAFRGEDVTVCGKRRFRPDGQVETLATIPISSWVPTDDVDVAVAALGRRMEGAFDSVDWDDDAPESKYVRSTAAAMRRHAE